MSEEQFINQMEPWFDEKETNACTKYMESGGWLMEFKKTREFEKAICDYTGSKYCHIVNNGTISLSIALLAFDIKPHDKVIVLQLTGLGFSIESRTGFNALTPIPALFPAATTTS